MISGASQADMGVLVISARKGEFETGYERGGQTREHALLAKTLGVQKLVVVINKVCNHMPSWYQSWRHHQCVEVPLFARATLRACWCGSSGGRLA